MSNYSMINYHQGNVIPDVLPKFTKSDHYNASTMEDFKKNFPMSYDDWQARRERELEEEAKDWSSPEWTLARFRNYPNVKSVEKVGSGNGLIFQYRD